LFSTLILFAAFFEITTATFPVRVESLKHLGVYGAGRTRWLLYRKKRNLLKHHTANLAFNLEKV